MAACPRLTELTVFYPHPHPHSPRLPGAPRPRDHEIITTGLPPCPVEEARSAISELVNACKALEDFSTLQIVHYSLTELPMRCWCGFQGCGEQGPYSVGRKQALRKQMKGVEDWTIECLKRPKIGPQERNGKKETMLRVIELSSVFDQVPRIGDDDLLRFHVGSVKVEEREVREVE